MAMTLEELMREVMMDRSFYARSGGGVTLTGGEPLLQPQFIKAFIDECDLEGIDTAMETSLLIDHEVIDSCCGNLKTFLVDVKSLDPSQYSSITGQKTDGKKYCDLLRSNIMRLASQNRNIILRCPIIPDFNDNKDHIINVIQLGKDAGVSQIDLLPFHQYGRYKYDSLKLPYFYSKHISLDDEKVRYMRDLIDESGLKCEIGG